MAPMGSETPGGSDGSATPPDDFNRLGDLLRLVEDLPVGEARSTGLAEPALERDGSARSVAAAWADVVGTEVAANARPVHLQRGRLVVSTSSSVWAQTLQLMSEAVLAGLRERVGPGVVERVVFRHAGWEERPQRPAGDEDEAGKTVGAGPAVEKGGAPALTEDETEALAAVERLDMPAALRDTVRKAMRAAFVRGEQDSVR